MSENPTPDEALAQAAAHHRAGRIADAERLYRAILEAQPRHTEANHELGALAMQAGKPEAALPHFKAALEADPSQSRYWLRYIDALIEAGRHGDALSALEQGRQAGLAGPAVEALAERAAAAATAADAFSMALTHHMAGRLAEAEEAYRQALVFNPRHHAALGNLGIALRDLGRSEEAAASYRRALEIMPDFAEAHSNLGNALRDLGRLEEAAASYRRALELKPDYAIAHSNLGIVFCELGRPAEAEASYRRALELQPDYAEAHSNLGNALKDLGRPEEAAASCRRALELNPDYAEAHSNLGNALRDLGRPAEAEASYRRALELKPDYAEAHGNLGIVLRELGRPEAAEASYRRALELKPDDAMAHYNLGNAHRERGRREEAEASYRRALEIKPDLAEAHGNLGIALRHLGRPAEAAASYRRALELKPDDAETHSNLGIALRDLGRLEEAAASYRRALEIEPHHAEAPTNLANMLYDTAPMSDWAGISQATLEDRRLTPAQRHWLLVHAAIGQWASGKTADARALLERCGGIDPSEGSVAFKKSAVNGVRYANFLERLLAVTADALAPSGDGPIVAVVGDSHCLSYANTTLALDDIVYAVRSSLIIGCKSYHLAKPSPNNFKVAMKKAFSRLPVGARTIVSVGEIDCRIDEGILKYSRKSDYGLPEIVEPMVESYVDFVATAAAEAGLKPLFLNVPAPLNLDMRDLRTSLTANDIRQLVDVITCFNRALAETLSRRNLPMADLYAPTAGRDGVADGGCHVDATHLAPGMLARVLTTSW